MCEEGLRKAKCRRRRWRLAPSSEDKTRQEAPVLRALVRPCMNVYAYAYACAHGARICRALHSVACMHTCINAPRTDTIRASVARHGAWRGRGTQRTPVILRSGGGGVRWAAARPSSHHGLTASARRHHDASRAHLRRWELVGPWGLLGCGRLSAVH